MGYCMKRSRVLSFWAILFFVFSGTSGCGIQGPRRTEPQKNVNNLTDPTEKIDPPVKLHLPCNEISEIQWRTAGGGNLHFRGKFLENKKFSIFEIKYDFHREHDPFEISDSSPIYGFLTKAFSGKFEIWSSPKSSHPTGSWTYVKFWDTCGNASDFLYAPLLKEEGIEISFFDLGHFVRDEINKSQSVP